MAFKMSYNKGKFPFKKITEHKTEPLKPGTKLWKGGTAPLIGGSGKIAKTFEKIVKSRALQNKQLQQMLEKSGYTFIKKGKK